MRCTVNAIAGTNEPYLAAPPAEPWYSQDAAAATAAYRVLIDLLPQRQPALEPLYEQSLAEIPDGAAKTGGIRVGEEAASDARRARGRPSATAREPVFGTEPGEWRPTPPDYAVTDTAWIADVEPFLIPSAEGLRTRGPNRLESGSMPGVQRDKELGELNSSTRTPEQRDVALYWDQAPWAEILASLAQSQNLNANDTASAGEVFLAGADAEITCISEKNYWNTWRPITAIREAAYDGNPATAPDRTGRR